MTQVAIAQGLPDPTGLPGTDEQAASGLLPVEGDAAAADIEGQSFNDILAWLCAQAEGEGGIPGAPKAVLEAAGGFGPSRAQYIDTSRPALGSRPSGSGASPTSATAHSASLAGYFGRPNLPNNLAPWNPQGAPSSNGAGDTMLPGTSAPRLVVRATAAESLSGPNHQPVGPSSGAEESAENGPARNSLPKAESADASLPTHMYHARNGDITSSRAPGDVGMLHLDVQPTGSNRPDSLLQGQAHAGNVAMLEVAHRRGSQNGPMARPGQDPAGLAGLLGQGQLYLQATEGAGQHPYIPGEQHTEDSGAGLDPLQEALAAMLDSGPGQARPALRPLPPAGFSGKPYPAAAPFQAFGPAVPAPAGQPANPEQQHAANPGAAPLIDPSGRPYPGPVPFQPFMPADGSTTTDRQRPIDTPTSSGSHQPPQAANAPVQALSNGRAHSVDPVLDEAARFPGIKRLTRQRSEPGAEPLVPSWQHLAAQLQWQRPAPSVVPRHLREGLHEGLHAALPRSSPSTLGPVQQRPLPSVPTAVPTAVDDTMQQARLSRPPHSHGLDAAQPQAPDGQAGHANQAALGGYQAPPLSVPGRSKPPAWFWDHHKMGLPCNATLHPHTALMLKQPLPPHAGEGSGCKQIIAISFKTMLAPGGYMSWPCWAVWARLRPAYWHVPMT